MFFVNLDLLLFPYLKALHFSPRRLFPIYPKEKEAFLSE